MYSGHCRQYSGHCKLKLYSAHIARPHHNRGTVICQHMATILCSNHQDRIFPQFFLFNIIADTTRGLFPPTILKITSRFFYHFFILRKRGMYRRLNPVKRRSHNNLFKQFKKWFREPQSEHISGNISVHTARMNCMDKAQR